MRIAKNELPIKINTPGALARQQSDFGDASNYGKFGAEHFTMSAGTDISPLLHGLEDNLCQSPHWGYMIQGQVTVNYKDGTSEQILSGDLFYWPPGHTVKVDQDAEFILYSPQEEHTPVLEHIGKKLGA